MKKYNFYYDESEHSRKINFKTIMADNYYDNFITVIIGCDTEKESDLFNRYALFEEKYADRKKHGELKSTVIKSSQLDNGFASLKKENLSLLEDFLDLFDENTLIYFSVTSKIEYIIQQLFENYKSNLFVDTNAMKYSIIKAVLTYKPKEIMEGIYQSTGELISLLKNFFQNRMEQNELNPILKQRENEAFSQILLLLDDISEIKTIDWNYNIAFVGFNKFLSEKGIDDYSLQIDKEGENGNTVKAAQEVGISNVSEIDSIDSCGIRMADMLAGIISKLLKALHNALAYDTQTDQLRKKLLYDGWFKLNESQLILYKKLYHVICELNNAWYKSFVGTYGDDLIVFVSLLQYMNHFNSHKEINENNIDMQGEYFNAYACESLENYYLEMKNKLQIDFIHRGSEDFTLNQRGAKVYYDVNKQPMLNFVNGKCVCNVLSVGFNKKRIPMVTVTEKDEVKCYRLPMKLSEWAVNLVALANAGVNMFPEKVVFSKKGDSYFADIL